MIIWTPITKTTDLPRLGTEESETLDFKEEAWKSGEDGSRELARDVTQFANHLGGSVVLGAVEDEDNRVVAFQHVEDAATVAQRVTDVCRSWLFPRLDVTTALLTSSDHKTVVVVNVEPADGVVAVTPRGKDYCEFYRRVDKSKKPLTFEEVERMWTDGRRGRVLVSRMPTEALDDVRLNAIEEGVVLTKRAKVRKHESHLEVAYGTSIFTFPYEAVQAVWPASDGGWCLALAARFYVRSDGVLQARYER
jgi:predicted HTH transcriptional regulator